MEFMTVIIIVIVIFGLIIRVVSKSISKGVNEEGHTENFPFPKSVAESRGAEVPGGAKEVDLWTWGEVIKEPEMGAQIDMRAETGAHINTDEGGAMLSLTLAEQIEVDRARFAKFSGVGKDVDSFKQLEDGVPMGVEGAEGTSTVKRANKGAGLLSDFDIKKAIVYSEILSPKFND